MTIQYDIFGNEHLATVNDAQEVANILKTYPAAATDTGLFYWLCLRTFCPAVSQLPENARIQLKEACRKVESWRRRKQEYTADNQTGVA